MIYKILFSCLIALTLAGCSSGENNVSRGNRLGILHLGNGTEPQELDPHIVTGLPEHHILIALLEGLVRKNPQNLEPVPGVAKSWQISEDGTVYTFTLRQHARWSNGDPVTAEDFRWSYWRAMQPALGNKYAYMFYPIKNAEAYLKGEITDFAEVGIRVLDTHRLEITLDNPTPYFLQLLDHQSYFPVHRPTLEKFGAPDERGTHWTRPGNFVGNGAFMLKDWRLNKLIDVEKNPYYWDSENVSLNGIRFYPTENVSTEERMFRAGQLHKTSSLPIDKIKVYRENNPEALRTAAYLGTYYYRFNTEKPPFNDKRVRKALTLAVDRQQIVAHVAKGGQLPAETFTPPDTLGYNAAPMLAFDPEQARQLLAEAGYPNGRGFPVTSLLYNTSEGHRKIAVAIQQMWKQHLNIDITLNNQDWKVYLDSVNSRAYEISRAGWIGDYVDPNTFLDMWVTDGGNNQTGWSNARYDEIISSLAPATADRGARYALFREAEAILLDELPVLPIYIYTSIHLVHPSVRGLHKNILNYTAYKNIVLQPEAETK